MLQVQSGCTVFTVSSVVSVVILCLS